MSASELKLGSYWSCDSHADELDVTEWHIYQCLLFDVSIYTTQTPAFGLLILHKQ